jgi:hypothetical protein
MAEGPPNMTCFKKIFKKVSKKSKKENLKIFNVNDDLLKLVHMVDIHG